MINQFHMESDVEGDPEHEGRLVHVERMRMRWGDMDALGHMNNTVYFRYLEQARISWFDGLGMDYRAQTGRPRSWAASLAASSCRRCTRRPRGHPDAGEAAQQRASALQRDSRRAEHDRIYARRRRSWCGSISRTASRGRCRTGSGRNWRPSEAVERFPAHAAAVGSQPDTDKRASSDFGCGAAEAASHPGALRCAMESSPCPARAR